MGSTRHGNGNGNGNLPKKPKGKPNPAPSFTPVFGEPELARLLALRTQGFSFRAAVQRLGVSHETAYAYLRESDRFDAYKKDLKVRWLNRVEELAEAAADWRGFAWMLERTFPGEFALHAVNRLEHSGAVACLVERIDETELLEMAQRAATIAGERPTHGLG